MTKLDEIRERDKVAALRAEIERLEHAVNFQRGEWARAEEEIDRLSRPWNEREPPHCSTCHCGYSHAVEPTPQQPRSNET